jgi:hypothetical protein
MKNTQLFCPNKECSCYGKLNHNIICYGTYTTKNDNIPRQRFQNTTCGCTFSETAFSEIYGKHGSFKENDYPFVYPI